MTAARRRQDATRTPQAKAQALAYRKARAVKHGVAQLTRSGHVRAVTL